MTRALAWDHDFTAEKRRAVDEVFGSDQLYLDTLATHPEHQLRGSGTRLVTQGTDIGTQEHVNVTLIAEPTARTFYLHLGFSSVDNVTIMSVDRDEKFSFSVMKYKL